MRAVRIDAMANQCLEPDHPACVLLALLLLAEGDSDEAIC